MRGVECTPVPKRKLPVGIQTFRQIREEGFYYVDKTGYARKLLDDDAKHYFLSRPRRFGKSLFVDTIKELFEGSEALFRGLAVHDGWDWSRRHPVVRLSFGGGNYGRPGQLLARMAEQLADLEREAGAPASEGATPSGRFTRLLAALHRQSGRRVVVLVDEYDKPILDALDDPETAKANRDDLRGLYGTIKECDAHIELTFITGVSKFSKVSLFSDLNNLTDLTLDPAYSAICGYTEADLDTVFAAELPGAGPAAHPRLVQRLWLAGGGQALQPLRHPQAVRQPAVPRALVRDRYPPVPHRHAPEARLRGAGSGNRLRRRRSAVRLRRGRHGAGGAAVSDRLPDHRGGGRGCRRPS